ncbi:DUF4249 domain-containing protein [Flavobacterium sp. MR2016-29]|uniref:DUF4249 domain-containing protein n=1 Tax=Flavobacterium sp. MR2016-29 TaxID=2783795 RepID=UPI00188B2847|nr:DUF4249 domain-containing protein [Flavobacterium sp. MR2016-29]MBF4494058.1 DUF4249 domain-containing protein [Flavobacterium sp. MR2016-29]
MDSKMKTIFINKIALFFLLSVIISSCTETYNLQTNTYEEALVVEATITNELKQQEIRLTKTSQFEDEGIKTEKGANVNVKDNKGNNYHFIEQDTIYVSETAFKAEPNTEYSLEIITADGKRFESTKEVLTTASKIESITPEVVTDSKEGRGVRISVKSYDPTNTSKYYRYKYEETFKIITPVWTSTKLVVTGPRELTEVPNSTDTKVCYSTKNSVDILQYTTTNLQEDRVNFSVRFISDQNYIISHRYTILVKQYVQNVESYSFYKTLKEIASSSSILSPKQPGFINGNIKCVTNSDYKAIGFFDVSSVDIKRIFFNYSDLFPGENLPPYYTDCSNKYYWFCFGFSTDPERACMGPQLISDIQQNLVTPNFYDPTRLDYYMVNAPCGDCTTFSSNKIPSFWIN